MKAKKFIQRRRQTESWDWDFELRQNKVSATNGTVVVVNYWHQTTKRCCRVSAISLCLQLLKCVSIALLQDPNRRCFLRLACCGAIAWLSCFKERLSDFDSAIRVWHEWHCRFPGKELRHAAACSSSWYCCLGLVMRASTLGLRLFFRGSTLPSRCPTCSLHGTH